MTEGSRRCSDSAAAKRRGRRVARCHADHRVGRADDRVTTAHSNGWIEVILVLVPLLVIAILLAIANQRANRKARVPISADAGGGSSAPHIETTESRPQ